MSSEKILIGRDAIMDYIGITSPTLFYELLGMGMPCRKLNGRLYAHAENIDGFFKHITFCKPPPEAAAAE